MLSVGIAAIIVALCTGPSIFPIDCQASAIRIVPPTKAGNETANKFDGIYSSVVANRPALNGTMVIDGLAVSYSCPPVMARLVMYSSLRTLFSFD